MRSLYIPVFWRDTGLQNSRNPVALKNWEINTVHYCENT